MTLVLLADTEREPLLEHVEWGTLLFFAALFVLMHGLEKLGLIRWIGNVVVTIIEAVRCCIAHWLSGQQEYIMPPHAGIPFHAKKLHGRNT